MYKHDDDKGAQTWYVSFVHETLVQCGVKIVYGTFVYSHLLNEVAK